MIAADVMNGDKTQAIAYLSSPYAQHATAVSDTSFINVYTKRHTHLQFVQLQLVRTLLLIRTIFFTVQKKIFALNLTSNLISCSGSLIR
jgi:hypothetical protein